MSPPTGSEGQDAGWKYSFKGITLVSITVEAAQVQGGVPQGILAAHRTVPELFTENDLSWGNFDTLVGDCPAQGGVSQNHSCACPVAIGARGLMLACVPLAEMDKKEHVNHTLTLHPMFLTSRSIPIMTRPQAPSFHFPQFTLLSLHHSSMAHFLLETYSFQTCIKHS